MSLHERGQLIGSASLCEYPNNAWQVPPSVQVFHEGNRNIAQVVGEGKFSLLMLDTFVRANPSYFDPSNYHIDLLTSLGVVRITSQGRVYIQEVDRFTEKGVTRLDTELELHQPFQLAIYDLTNGTSTLYPSLDMQDTLRAVEIVARKSQ